MYYYRQIVFATSFIQFFTVNKATICQIMKSKAANSQNTLVHGAASSNKVEFPLIDKLSAIFFHEKETQKLLTILLLLNILLTGGF